MPTNLAVTRSISIQAEPEAVLDLVADAHALPRWAPGFARAVTQAGEHWAVDTGQGEALIDLRVSRDRGTVDIVSVAQPAQGVFTRVLPNGDGAEYLFTQFFPDATPEEAMRAQTEVIETELETIRRLVEA